MSGPTFQPYPTKAYRKHLKIPKPHNRYMTDKIEVSKTQIEFGVSIRNYRRVYNLSQQEFAEICSLFAHKPIHFTMISQYENFKHIPSEKNMNYILAAMGMTINDLQ